VPHYSGHRGLLQPTDPSLVAARAARRAKYSSR
jgi:hypothetical protein